MGKRESKYCAKASFLNKGQAGTEYLMIASFLIIVIGIAFLYTSTTLSNSVDDSKARTATNNIANAINQVYALGQTHLQSKFHLPLLN